MKVKVQKLGRIQNSEFDLKPLTVFVGPNNTGKTWLAYTLSAIFGLYGEEAYRNAYVEGQLPETYPPLDDAIKQVLARGDAKIDLYSFAENYGEQYFNNVASSARHWMSSFMNTQYALFDNLNMSITLDEMKAAFLQRIKDYSFESKISHGLLNISKKSDENLIYIYTTSEIEDNKQITDRLPAEAIKKHLIQRVTQAIHRSLYPHIRVFPTERTAIIAFNLRNSRSKSVLFDALFKRRYAQLLKAAIGPVDEFISTLNEMLEIDSIEIERRKELASNNSQIQKYCDLADVLEKDILTGGVTFSTAEPDPRRTILFQPAQNINLEIPIASSMVKELSSLVLYLRYLARPGELIIIDEPEMNLHPIAQVKIIEFLAALVNAGLHILITTHSTYVVDHLGNLFDAYKHEKKDEVVDLFLLQREDSFIDQNQVSIYEVTENGTIENILDQNEGIDWQTFSDVTDLVQRIHFEL